MIAGAAICAILLTCIGGCQKGGADVRPAITGSALSIEPIPALTLRAGESATVTIRANVGDGYHVQANPASNEFLIPMELQLEHADGITFGSPGYPEGHPYRLTGTEEVLLTYEGEVSVTVPIRVAPDASPGERSIEGSLSYQACNSRSCLFPTSVQVIFKIIISA